ncbi:MAG: MFS transporter [Chloroflexota bacterium]
MASVAIENDNEKPKVNEQEYRKRIRAWILYDWANSAFVTTVLAALLPAYFSAVAGATLPSEATATAYWGFTLSISTFIVAILSPILGTISDIQRGKKKFLAIFMGLGVIGAGLLVFVSTGDWFIASIFVVLGRIGFTGANVFYDALLPHVAREEDQDVVSTRGFALGYLGGGILLAVNVAMFLLIPDTLFDFAGIRLSFLSVAIWWLVFSIPILRDVPEPPSASKELSPGESLVTVTISRLGETFSELRRYRELFKYLIAFLIYNDPINTIIGVATIYGAELGFGTLELVLALLLVQFVGVPFTLIFGRLPSADNPRRPFYLAYILFNMVMLPTVAVIGANTMDITITGNQPAPYETVDTFTGEGLYTVADAELVADDTWTQRTVTGDELAGDSFLASFIGTPDDVLYAETDNIGATYDLQFNGQNLELIYAVSPTGGIIEVLIDGEPLIDEDESTLPEDVEEGENPVLVPLTIDTYNPTVRYNDRITLSVPEEGQYTLTLINSVTANPDSTGTNIAIASIEVEEPVRQNNLAIIIGLLFGLQVVGGLFAVIFGRFFKGFAEHFDTRNSILLAILMYSVIAVWGFFLNSTIEFWFLAWMVATVQGGSQALSRSLYASLSPSSKSGEFFGLFSILSKGASVIGTGIFAFAALAFNNSRPAILSLIVLFVIGAYLLTRVDIEEGKRVAKEEDAEVYGTE